MSSDENLYENLGLHLDVLKEISNIGAGNAATSLAQMLNKKVSIGIPNVSFLDFSQISYALGGSETIFAAVLVNLSRDIEGMMMFLLDIPSANLLIESLMGTTRDKDCITFDEVEMSIVKEIGNILSASYLNSLGTLTNLVILPSIPHMAIDMVGALLSVPAIEFGKIGDQALYIESQLKSTKGSISEIITGYFILVPELDSFDLILRSLGVL